MARIIKTTSHDDWMAQRSKGIGSSEVGTLLGLNPYCTPYKLWLRKTGQAEPEPENEAMLLGHLLEDAVAQRWSIETGNQIIKSSAEEIIYVHPEHDYFRASPDRLYWQVGDKHNEQSKRILECKTTVLDIDADNIPQSWFCQVQWLMHCSGLKNASLAWLRLDRREFGYKDISYDADFCDWLATQADIFWHDNVLGGQEPAFTNVSDILLKFPRSAEGKTVQATGSVTVNGEQMSALEACRELKELRERQKELDNEIEALEAGIKAYMGDAEAIVVDAGGKSKNIVTWKSAKDSRKLDTKRLTAELPDVAEQYMKDVAGARRFVVK